MFRKINLIIIFIIFFISVHASDKEKVKKVRKPIPCTCGIFLSGQFKKGSKEAPKGEPVLLQELETHFPNNPVGQRKCANNCLEVVISHLPKSSNIICATLDRDCYKEKAYLFTKNFVPKWVNSNMSAGREFCCKDNQPYKCPVV